MRIGLAQLDQAFEDKETTKARIADLLGGDPIDLLVLPEMTLTGFSMDSRQTTLTAEDHAWFQDLARRGGHAIIYGGVEDGCNCLNLVDRRGLRARPYGKRHLFGLGGEREAYLPGSDRIVWELEGWRILPAVCYDLRFTYHFWDLASEIDAVVVSANWPASRRGHWRALLQARAIENLVPVLGCNRIGRDPMVRYCGDSLVFDAMGEVVADAGAEATLLRCTLERERTREVRRKLPFLNDRLA